MARHTIQWQFEFEEDLEELDLDPGITAVSRTVTSTDVLPMYSRCCLPAQQYFLLQLYQRADEYIYAVDCEGLETNAALQSLDVVVQDVDGNRRWLCYIWFVENNIFCAYPGRNPDH